MRLTNERDDAVLLANKVLDRANADPDDDLALLARQLLRTREELATAQAQLNESESHRHELMERLEDAGKRSERELARIVAEAELKGELKQARAAHDCDWRIYPKHSCANTSGDHWSCMMLAAAEARIAVAQKSEGKT